MTIERTAHARFWENLIRLGWAEKLYSPIDPVDLEHEPLCFRLTEKGWVELPRFLVFYNLLNMGACAPAADKKLKADQNELASQGLRLDPKQFSGTALTNLRWRLLYLFLGMAIGASVEMILRR